MIVSFTSNVKKPEKKLLKRNHKEIVIMQKRRFGQGSKYYKNSFSFLRKLI